MRLRRFRPRWLAAGGLAGAAALLLWLAVRAAPPEPSRATAAVPAGPERVVVVAQAQLVPIDGVIEVRPLAEGRVLQVLVQPGDRVVADQLLALLESDLPAAGVRQRRAEVRAAAERAALAGEGLRPEEQAALVAAAQAARDEAGLARDRWQRQRQLLDQGYATAQSVLDAQRTLDAAAARERAAQLRAAAATAGGRVAEVRAARAQVASAGAALSADQVALARTRIVAPIAGVVMARNVNPGDIIGANTTAPTLFRIVDASRTEVRFEFEEGVAPRVALGLPVEYTLTGGGSIVGHGTVTRIAPQVERRTIGADDARARADSMVLPAWGDFTPRAGQAPLPVNFRLEARVQLDRRPANQESNR